jgi:class 3 adenylate cyclase
LEDWLSSINLVHHVAAFRASGITIDQFAVLTEDDLRELGLTIGERKRFLQARETRSTSAKPEPAPSADATAAQVRPLTIMFIDLAGSTALGERLDPEDLMEVLRRYRELCVTAIARFGGTVARFIGDGVLAYFSYPAAHENDPERAVRAALDITRRIPDLETPAGTTLQVRIGLATGRVIVGDLFAGGETDRHTVIGSTPNLAARLQGLAGPNGIVVAEATHERIRDRFACEPLTEVALAGFAEPRRPWRVLGELPPQRRVDGPATRRLTGLHGRDPELDMLRIAWRRAEQGEGKVVLVVGEAGLGKSRLVEEMVAHELGPETRVIALLASAFDDDSPLRPVIDHLRTAAGIEAADHDSAALAKLESILLGSEADRAAARAIVANLIGIGTTDPEVGQLLPNQLRDRTIDVVVDQVLRLAELQPLCIVVEDLHWLDPTSRDLLEILSERIRDHRVLILLTAREGAAQAWAEKADLVVRLGRLSPPQVAAIMRDLFAWRPVPPELAQGVATRSDGVPLFVEEITRVMLQGASGTARTETQPDWAIPASLDGILMSHLDRAGPAKAIDQAAAVVGRRFDADLLAAVCGLPGAVLHSQLPALVEAGVLDSEPGRVSDRYWFHHALLRDAAYASLLREPRRDLHARVAEAMLATGHEDVTLHPEVLARHLTEGGKAEDAATHWMEAARRSLGRSALAEATAMLRRGLDALELLRQTPRTTSLRLQMSALLGPALISLKGASAPETRELYGAAYELSHGLPEEPAHFPIYWGWWRMDTASMDRAQALLDRARTRDDPGLMLQAHHCCWSTLMNIGDLDRCCEHIDAGLAIYTSGDYRHHARLYGNHDVKACAHGVLSQLDWMQGRLRKAIDEERASLAWADELDHLGSRIHAMGMSLLHRVYRRDYAEVLERSERLMALATAHGLSGVGAAGLIFTGWVRAMQGDPDTGLHLIDEGWARQTEIATNEDYPVYLCLMAETLTAMGRPEHAVERVARE